MGKEPAPEALEADHESATRRAAVASGTHQSEDDRAVLPDIDTLGYAGEGPAEDDSAQPPSEPPLNVKAFLVRMLVAVILFVTTIVAALNLTSGWSTNTQVSASGGEVSPRAAATEATSSTSVATSARAARATPVRAKRSSTPATMRNRFANLDPQALADAELGLAQNGGACSTLRLWYDANPGDSNVQIAQHYYSECGVTPPPVASGELSMSDLRDETPETSVDGSLGTPASGGNSGMFLAGARGTYGSGWPYQSDSSLLSLGHEVCSLLGQGMPAGELIGALLGSGSGATEREVVDLVNAANSDLC